MRKISIVMPVYNMEEGLAQSLERLVNQTYQNIEIIVVDDGSTDRSSDICRSYMESDERIRVIHTENSGAGPARNLGISEASGEYIYFPDADDLLESNAIMVLMEAIARRECDLYVFGFKTVDTKGKTIRIKEYPDAIRSGEEIRNRYEDHLGMMKTYSIQGALWNKLFSLRLIKAHCLEFPNLRRHQDEVFIARYVNHVKNVCFVSEILYTYYANDLRKTWEKYPPNYLEIVSALRTHRLETIFQWNPENQSVAALIENDYLRGVINALELSLSPKYKMTNERWKSWIKEAIVKAELNDIALPKGVNKLYPRFILSSIQTGEYNTVYRVLFLKVFLEKTFLSWIR